MESGSGPSNIRRTLGKLTRRLDRLVRMTKPKAILATDLPPIYAPDICDDELIDDDESAVGSFSEEPSLRTIFDPTDASEHNARLPINTLPLEVLQTIFSTTADLEPRWRIIPIIVISHTCSHWRTVALSYPALWSKIEIAGMSLNMVQLLFERAGPHLIEISTGGGEINYGAWTWVCDNLHRILTLKMDVVNGSHPMRLVTGLIPFSAPHLSHVSLRFKSGLWGNSSECVVPEKLFKDYTPNLRRIELEGIRMPWNNGLYVGLTTLVIRNCSVGVRHWQDVDICLALQDCPNLEVLSLRLSVDHDWDYTTDALIQPRARPRPVDLPSLHAIELDAPIHYIRYLLSSIESSALRALAVTILHVPLDDYSLVNIFEPGLVSHHIMSHLHGIRICGDGSVTSARTAIVANGQTEAGNEVQFTMFMDNMDVRQVDGSTVRQSLLPQISQSIRDNYTLPALRRVLLFCGVGGEGAMPCSTDAEEVLFWNNMMSFPSIESLTLAGRGPLAIPVVKVLEEDLKSKSGIIAPQIKQLVIENASLSSSELRVVLNWCHTRPMLPCLDLYGSTIMADSMADMHKLVGDAADLGVSVDWGQCDLWNRDSPPPSPVSEMYHLDEVYHDLSYIREMRDV